MRKAQRVYGGGTGIYCFHNGNWSKNPIIHSIPSVVKIIVVCFDKGIGFALSLLSVRCLLITQCIKLIDGL